MITIFTSKKTATFNKVLKMTEELQQKLLWVSGINNGMDKIVEFFKTTSPYHDKFLLIKGLNQLRFKDEKKQKFFQDFRNFLSNTGRSDYGWNRTVINETIFSSCVYVNMKVPYDELFFTRTVAEHLSRRNNPKGEIDHVVKENAYGKWNETGLVENEFVNPFMKKNYDFLNQILKEFKN